MTIFRSEDLLVGLIALAAVPWIGWIIRRGLRNGQLPIGRGTVAREERRGAFTVLIVFYVVSAALLLFIALDLIVGLGVRT